MIGGTLSHYRRDLVNRLPQPVISPNEVWIVLRHSRVGQISPDKDVDFHHTAASFTLSAESWASVCGATLPADWALYDVSVRRLVVLHSGFLQTPPRGDALAFG